MNLNQLRFARTVAHTLSFTQAAERCYVTQPTLSNGVAQLEEELGGRMFDRTTRAVTLTPFGQHMLPMIASVLDSYRSLEKEAEAYWNPSRKLLRIGLSPLIDMRLLTIVLEPFQRNQTDVEVFFKECYLDDLDQRLHAGQIDIALRPHLASRLPPIGQEQCHFYQAPLYYLSSSPPPDVSRIGGPVSIETILHETYVLTPDVCGLATATRDLFSAYGGQLKTYPGQALSYQVMQDWADLGIGAAILPLSKLSAENRPKAQPIMSCGTQAVVNHDTIWQANLDHPPHVKALHEHFRDTVPKLVSASNAEDEITP